MLDGTRYFIYTIVPIWKMMIFVAMAWGLSTHTSLLMEPYSLFTKFTTSFDSHSYNVTEIKDIIYGNVNGTSDALELLYIGTLFTQEFSPSKPSKADPIKIF